MTSMKRNQNYTIYDIERVAKHFDAQAIRSGQGWLTRCPCHQTRDGKNLSISLGYNKNLLAHCFAGCNYLDVLQEISRHVKLTSFFTNSHKNEYYFASNTSEYINKIIAKILQETRPVAGTLVETYLKVRGIKNSLPDNLEFHPSLEYREKNEATGKSYVHSRWPAMVAKIRKWPDSEINAIHRTYLQRDGSGKAPIAFPKMALGSWQSGAIGFGELNRQLILTEGIETALSIYEAKGICTWSVISASGFESLVIPPVSIVPEIIVAADNDKAGKEATKAFSKKWIPKGYTIKIALPPVEQDFNDLLLNQLHKEII